MEARVLAVQICKNDAQLGHERSYETHCPCRAIACTVGYSWLELRSLFGPYHGRLSRRFLQGRSPNAGKHWRECSSTPARSRHKPRKTDPVQATGSGRAFLRKPVQASAGRRTEYSWDIAAKV